MAETQDATLLQRRARRRLVGAIALVVLVVIVLPIVLDREPSPVGRDLVIEIPNQDAGRFNSSVRQQALSRGGEGSAALSPSPKPEHPASAEKDAPVPAPAKEGAEISKKERKSESSANAEAARAKALLEGKDTWVISIGAFANQANVKQLLGKMAAAGVHSYTEALTSSKGENMTRVRAGPFDSKRKAEQVQKKLVAAGVPPGKVEQQ